MTFLRKFLSRVVVVGLVFGGAIVPSVSADTLKCDFRPLKKLGPPKPALVTDVPSIMTPVALNSVQIVDKNIRKKIMPQAVFARMSPTGTVEVMARLVNCTDYDQEILVRTSFMDLSQMPSEPTSIWKRLFLSPKSTQVYTEKSMLPDVGYYLIEVDEGD
ncbi:putative periplasmic lipoprotein [Kordiimonas pumila]|uniref:Uncharacterized protein n=1 Tax=Kordiimonas pumila TaxID=2161677 RepID=A0ABV7D964_9PROT|nr:hypothetical protein [Kordiimonas pumila]